MTKKLQTVIERFIEAGGTRKQWIGAYDAVDPGRLLALRLQSDVGLQYTFARRIVADGESPLNLSRKELHLSTPLVLEKGMRAFIEAVFPQKRWQCLSPGLLKSAVNLYEREAGLPLSVTPVEERARRAFDMRIFGASFAEIGTALGVSPSYASTLAQREAFSLALAEDAVHDHEFWSLPAAERDRIKARREELMKLLRRPKKEPTAAALRSWVNVVRGNTSRPKS